MSDRAAALESLVSHPGWQAFFEHAKEEWGPAGCWRKAKEMREVDPVLGVQKIDYTNEQVGRLLAWPQDELARLMRAEASAEPALSRGGYTR